MLDPSSPVVPVPDSEAEDLFMPDDDDTTDVAAEAPAATADDITDVVLDGADAAADAFTAAV